jgi:hypothetical protein
MRWLSLVLLLACRTQPFELEDGGAPDLSHPPSGAAPPCSPKFPDGVCPPQKTCCPFSCWGGNDVTGWCFDGDGCPVC